MSFEGVFSVLPTPFDGSGEVDEGGLAGVIELFLADGVTGLTALGVTSEVARLSDEERERILRIVMERVAGRVPVVVGATAGGLHTCLRYCRQAAEAGASGVMVSPPRMPKLNSDAVRKHFAALAENVDLPIVVQDYPPISGYAMEPWLLVRLAREIPAVRAIKLEDAPTPYKCARIREEAGGTEVAVFGGLGGSYLLEELIAGATGAMTGFAFPKILVEIVAHFHSGRVEEAADVFYRHAPLMRFEFQEGIGMAIRKEMLRRRGAFPHAGIRAPGAVLDRPTREALDRILAWLELE